MPENIAIMIRLVLINAFLITALATGFGQAPVPESDTVRNTVRQGDPEPRTLPSNDYLEGFLRIMPDELPLAVKRTLQNDDQYRGWRKAATYTNRQQTRFIVEMSVEETVKTWQFDAAGQLIPLQKRRR